MAGSRQETRSTRRRQVEQLVASCMDVSRWRALNKVPKPALYGWMRVFRDEEPELFGGEGADRLLDIAKARNSYVTAAQATVARALGVEGKVRTYMRVLL